MDQPVRMINSRKVAEGTFEGVSFEVHETLADREPTAQGSLSARFSSVTYNVVSKHTSSFLFSLTGFVRKKDILVQGISTLPQRTLFDQELVNNSKFANFCRTRLLNSIKRHAKILQKPSLVVDARTPNVKFFLESGFKLAKIRNAFRLPFSNRSRERTTSLRRAIYLKKKKQTTLVKRKINLMRRP
ncbi:MAG: hypothetical protein Q7S92_03105 [Candidatus Diapherotrites archaeon]|nr:hypothetical protein [Candidatus Diapherotrites archaeon]